MKRKPLAVGLMPKQVRFVEEYLIDSNGKQAAIRCGYSPRTAEVQASRLLSKAKVRSYLVEKQAKLSEKLAIKAEDVIEELRKIGFANMQDFIRISKEGDPYIDLSKLTREQAAALSETTVEDYTEGRGPNARDVKRVKIKLHEKIPALVNLGKHLGLFAEKKELTGPGGGPIQHNVRVIVVTADGSRYRDTRKAPVPA